MLKAVHRINESLAHNSELPAEDSARSTREQREKAEVFLMLRSLRQKARRLRLWLTALNDTERGIVNASLTLETHSLGGRLKNILHMLARKLKENLKANYFRQLEEKGAEMIRSTVVFLYGDSRRAQELLRDTWLLRYSGTRFENAARLGFAAATS
jgi:hypothetical protein